MTQTSRDDCVSRDSKLAVEKVRYHLKKIGIENLETIYHDYYNWIMQGTYMRWNQSPIRHWHLHIIEDGFTSMEMIKIYVLIRRTISDHVAMNRGYYEIERAAGTNPLLILSDIRKSETPKFAFLNYLVNKRYIVSMTPLVLFPEKDFSEMSELKQILEIE